MKRFFVTHIVPRDKILKHNLSVAACNFCHNLIEGGGFDKVFSILPTFVCNNVEPFDGLVYSRLRKYRILNKIAPLIENASLFFKIPKWSSVWYYNCTILNATLIILLKLFKPTVKQQMIILDYTPGDKPADRVFLWLTNKMNGTIRLADSPLFTVSNSICLPGVVPDSDIRHPQINNIKNEFLISGILNDRIAMLPLLLDVFSKMPDLRLHITGKAPDMDLIKRYTGKYDNIIYHGMVNYDEYLSILHDTTFLLSTRNPSFPENQCNFPSKIIEALLHNRIVVSTLHYEQLDGIRYIEVPATHEGLTKKLQEIVAMPHGQLLQYANQASEVRRQFNSSVWNESMDKIEEAR